VMLSLSGEDPMFAPSFFYREECVHPWGRWWRKGEHSPYGSKLNPGGRFNHWGWPRVVKNRPKSVSTYDTLATNESPLRNKYYV
jgi:hypothetical protein